MMRVKLFSQVQNLKSSLFSKSTPFCIFLIALTTSFLLSPTCATAASPSLKQEVLEQGFRSSLTEIKQLVPAHVPQPTCFISRVCEDDTWGDRIEPYLRQIGVQTIYDKKDLRGNDDIQAFVEQINMADFVMTLFSPRYLENYGKRTWIHKEADLIKQRLLKGGRGFHIPILLAGRARDSMPLDFFDPTQTLYYPMTKEHQTDEDECYESLFRILKEQVFREDFEEGASGAVGFSRIKGKFDVRRSKLPSLLPSTEFQSATGFFPQSLKTYNAFLDRTDKNGLSYLDRIFEELFVNEDVTTRFSTTTLCTSGMGGVGKTTLATEYARKYGAFYDLVYWMDGSSRGDVLRSCLALLEVLKVPLPERGNADEETHYSNVIRLVNDNLSGMRRHSLLVIDNVEDPALVAELSSQKGHILYTSRNNDWLRKIDVDVLKREESVKLLLQLTGLDPALADQALVLAEELGDLPLALAQAAAYIKQQRLPTFETYLGHYRASQADLLAKKQIQPSLNKREAVVMTIWNTTMRKLSPESQQLMSYFAYLAPTAIPMQIFKDIEHREDALEELVHYSMAKQLEGSTSIHRLVQLVTRLNMADRVGQSLKYLLGSMRSHLQADDNHSWSRNVLLPHTEVLLEHTSTNKTNIVDNMGDIESILENLSWIYTSHSYYSKSKNAFRSFFSYILEKYGSSSPNVLKTKFYMAQACGYLREYQEAIKLYYEILTVQEQTLGRNAMTIFGTLHNLAVTCGWDGDYKTQVGLYERSLGIFEENLRKGITKKNNHFIILITNLANCYWHLGNHGKQRETLEKLQDSSGFEEGVLEKGQDFIDGAWGLYCGSMGEFVKQKEHFERMLEKRRMKYGEEHSLITESLARVGEAYKNLGEFERAEEHLQRALGQKRREDQRFRGTALKIWGGLYYVQRKPDLALEKFREALAYQRSAFKENHPELAQLHRRMGEVYIDQGNLVEAEPCLTKALEIQKNAFGESHPEYMMTLRAIEQLELRKNR